MRARIVALFALSFAIGCGGQAFYRMPLRPIVWIDPDQRELAVEPGRRYVSWRFDALDHLMFRPVSDVWRFPTDRESINVNALDEVPDSSWFTNRIGRFGMTEDEVARGACESMEIDAPFPWTVVGGKPDGTNPGFTIEDANGTKYLLKTDGRLQPERASAADAIAAALYHAAGYYAPCNRVMYFRRDDLRISEDAESESSTGQVTPLTREHVEIVLRAATRTRDGRYRAALSRFVEGEPVGPWSYEEMLPDDPNDVVPHTRRRDLRALYVLAAWTGHIDSRQENTMSAWMDPDENGRGYLRHYLIDFGDCFGVLIDDTRLARRFEHDHYLNLGTVAVDFATAGLIDRPWQHARFGRAGRALGFFDDDRFDPEDWDPGYPNPAFDAQTEHDAAWMARIVARFSPAHVEALVTAGRFQDRVVEEELARILNDRRRRILERFLTRLSPLAWPRVEGERVCFEDMAVSAGIRIARQRRYAAWIAASEPSIRGRLRMARACVEVPRARYAAIDVVASGPERTLPLRLHVYRSGDGIQIAGIERLSQERAP